MGQFDGKTFTKEQDPLLMDVGPDFYAAQTFFRPNFPTKALIQIAWHDHWNGGVGEKGWERHATFPVEVGLVTYEGRMRITRTPIAGIKTLYKGTKTWKNETLADGKNLLAGVKSKTFDLTAVFDLKETNATGITFRIANVPLKYDIKAQMFHGMRAHKHKFIPIPNKPKALKPDANGLLKIRMLVDWSQLEVFSAGGVFSYSANLPFTPKDSSLGLTATGGDVKLVSMTMNEVGRIWPKASE